MKNYQYSISIILISLLPLWGIYLLITNFTGIPISFSLMPFLMAAIFFSELKYYRERGKESEKKSKPMSKRSFYLGLFLISLLPLWLIYRHIGLGCEGNICDAFPKNVINLLILSVLFYWELFRQYKGSNQTADQKSIPIGNAKFVLCFCIFALLIAGYIGYSYWHLFVF